MDAALLFSMMSPYSACSGVLIDKSTASIKMELLMIVAMCITLSLLKNARMGS
jgi:hypothetical protein